MHVQQLLLTALSLGALAHAGSLCIATKSAPREDENKSSNQFIFFPASRPCEGTSLQSGNHGFFSVLITEANFCENLPITLEACGTKATLLKMDDATPLDSGIEGMKCGVRLQIGNMVCLSMFVLGDRTSDEVPGGNHSESTMLTVMHVGLSRSKTGSGERGVR